jgi:cell wall-associated NlpC family hydrolase
MNKTRIVSATLFGVLLLSTGCIQQKSSGLQPLPKVVTPPLDTNQSSENNRTITSKITTPPITHKVEPIELIEADNLDSLALAVQERIDEPVVDTTSSSVGEDWVEITKEEEIILTAQEFMGAKYVWAANGPECFDCSGFTKYVYRENGMTIPRYSGHQAKVGIKVSYDELQVGDLVFFDTEKKYRKKVNHVGIYMGDNKFIHASSAKKRVIITSFNEKQFYKRRFLWGQRVVNSNSAYASLK